MKNVSDNKQVIQRLQQATNSQLLKDLAAILKVTPQAISTANNRGKIPTSWIFEIAERYDVSVDWLIFGRGDMRIKQVNSEPDEASTVSQEPQKSLIVELKDLIKILPTKNGKLETFVSDLAEFILIPMVGAVLSAGCGSLQTEGGSERKYAFRSDFLRRKGNMQEMVVMRVEGDSMYPSIEDGDVVLIDQSQKTLRPDSVYAVGVEDMIYLKRVNAKPGKIILASDNPDYEKFEVSTSGDLADLVRIIGRIVWSSREW